MGQSAKKDIPIYLAARYSRRQELCSYRHDLEGGGFCVTSRWLNGGHQIDDAGHPIGESGEDLVERGDGDRAAALRRRFAIEDMDGVAAAEVLVAFTELPRSTPSRGGRHVEFGLAIGMGLDVMIVGPRENVFCWLPGVMHFEAWHLALEALRRRRVRMGL